MHLIPCLLKGDSMNILITNDDGINAPGIAVLAEVASAFGDVTVVAPASQCSAMSHRITFKPMKVEEHQLGIPGVKAYSVDGTPADCVKTAVDALMEGKPDVVLSGINNGYNVGFDIAYSGTVGAAMEALMLGIPAVALSQLDVDDFAASRHYLPQILPELLAAAPSATEIWNVNIPAFNCKGIRRDCTVSRGGYYNGTMELRTENGELFSQYPPYAPEDFPIDAGTPGSDLEAVTDGFVAIGRVRCPVM